MDTMTDMQKVNGVSIINVCEVLQKSLGDNWIDAEDEEASRIINEYIKNNDAYYYARPNDEFFMWEAVDGAKRNGKGIVVVENLS